MSRWTTAARMRRRRRLDRPPLPAVRGFIDAARQFGVSLTEPAQAGMTTCKHEIRYGYSPAHKRDHPTARRGGDNHPHLAPGSRSPAYREYRPCDRLRPPGDGEQRGGLQYRWPQP